MHRSRSILFFNMKSGSSVFKMSIYFSTGSQANKANRQFKILEHVFRAFMLRSKDANPEVNSGFASIN
jgi:hypothetical protein